MTITNLINKVLCRNLADRPKPLRTPRSHPDEIPRRNGIPRIPEPVNSSTFEHHKSVFHNVHLYYTQRGAGLVDHGVNRKIEAHFVRQQALYLQCRIISEWMRYNIILMSNNQRRRNDSV